MQERYLFISDIHSNYPALRTVMEDSAKFDPFVQIFCPGDVVGYGAFPNECVEAVRQIGALSVIGNHDRAVVTEDAEYFNQFALWAVKHNKEALKPENTEYLRRISNTPYVDPQGRFAMVHGSFAGVGEPQNTIEERFEDIYILDHITASDALKSMKFNGGKEVPLGVVGHTHRPMMATAEIEIYNSVQMLREFMMDEFTSDQYTNGGIVFETTSKDVLDNGRLPKTIFNFGSVGQPRHGSPNACYGIVEFDDEIARIIFRHVEYDVGETQERMIKEGFPDHLITRLELGK